VVILFSLAFLVFFSAFGLLVAYYSKSHLSFFTKDGFSTDCAWAVEKQTKHFCISKTPGNAGSSKKL